MKSSKTKISESTVRREAYSLQHELEALIDEMGFAMRWAYMRYVASGRMTPRMDMVLARYYDLARRYKQAGY